MRAIVMTRLVLPSGIVPSTRHTFSLSFSMGPCGSTVQLSKHFAMGRGVWAKAAEPTMRVGHACSKEKRRFDESGRGARNDGG